ncbi:MAG: hypothetical protein RBR86_09800 [Pseudobdellovibrionaceae bacterium]|nr:hypothetical protein [Pseudobdellovibrionaceae bacterium]
MLHEEAFLSPHYFTGEFRYSDDISRHIDEERFKALKRQFRNKYDDFYHPYFAKYGDKLNANKALISVAFELFRDVHGHLPLAYKNCAISSGTWAHLDAVQNGHFTTDRLSRIVGSDWHTRTIKDNSQRSLERIERIRDLFLEVFFIAPTMFEGSTRVFSKGYGRVLTDIPFQAEEYMAFWNMIIDLTQGFVLDDVRLDTPDIDRVQKEIEMVRSGRSGLLDTRPILQTSDWANSRNSIYEMARGNYIRFGLHPLRPDAKMDMRVYDQESHRLYHARLIDTLKPVLQNILRWAPQGIAVDSAVITAARLMNLHRMRIDPAYNRMQEAPLELDTINPKLAKPTQAECREFNVLLEKFEPFLMEYLPYLVNPNGLYADYSEAQKKHPIKPKNIGEVSIKWQKENIPQNLCLDLWALTENKGYDAIRPKPAQKFIHGSYRPQRRQHDFEKQPFDRDTPEIWKDEPFELLDPMFMQLAKSHIGVLEIIARNSNSPEYRGVYSDMKRGELALDIASVNGMSDLSHLAGALGKSFSSLVRDKNLHKTNARMQRARKVHVKSFQVSCAAFGTSNIVALNTHINEQRKNFIGPGPNATPAEYRLAIMMEMLRRNFTSFEFEKNWEASEDACRLMLLATKIEFGLVKRPAGNDTDLRVVNEDQEYISFADRIIRLHTYLQKLKEDTVVKRAVIERNSEVLEGYGIHHISLTLARMLEIYDCLIDQAHNNNRFELRRIDSANLIFFSENIHSIAPIRESAARAVRKEWCWLWQETDFDGLRQEYKDKWMEIQGVQAKNIGRDPDHSRYVVNRYGPR